MEVFEGSTNVKIYAGFTNKPRVFWGTPARIVGIFENGFGIGRAPKTW
ncbi:MAG: hypothetical protein MPI93_06115 [Nitrosopumilus sp.]|nr:hypothetical protein [Nitrosopumilus sp.]